MSATAVLVETSHVADCKAVSPTEDVYGAVSVTDEGTTARDRVE